jgi:hypothetical protein
MRTKDCRCGHGMKVHSGINTECGGFINPHKNPVGVWLYDYCQCREYRRSERGVFWRWHTYTEDYQGMVP